MKKINITAIALLAFFLAPSLALSTLPWNGFEVDKAKNHSLIVDFGVTVSQGVRLDKIQRNGKTAYTASIVAEGRILRRMPISRMIFSDRYHQFRNLFIAPKSTSANEELCRAKVKIARSSNGDPETKDAICQAGLKKSDQEKLGRWYQETLTMIEKSAF